MTIPTSASSTTVMGDGSNTSFDFNFVADASTFIEVIYNDATGAQTTLSSSQYTLLINPPATGQIWGVGGTVTYPISGSPIANGTSLTISRVLPYTQTITISNQGDFAPQVIEEMGDTLEMQIQQVAARTGQLRGTWVSGTSYTFGDVVVDGANGSNTGNFYMCVIGNTAGVWADDLAAGDWTLAIQVNAGSAPLPLSVANGGTSFSTYSQGDTLYAADVAVLAKLAKDTNATRYMSNQGANNNPSWNQINLANGVTGALPVANGGTGTAVSTGTGALVLQVGPTIDNTILAGTSTVVSGLFNISSAGAGQIQFPATQNPSVGLNTLDDYEEINSFIPTLTFTSGSAAGTFTGFSTKVGRLVSVSMQFIITGVSSPSGVVTIGNLPYPNLIAVGSRVAACVLVNGISASFTGSPCAYVDVAQNSIVFQEFSAGFVSNPGAKITNTTNLSIAATYFATA